MTSLANLFQALSEFFCRCSLFFLFIFLFFCVLLIFYFISFPLMFYHSFICPNTEHKRMAFQNEAKVNFIARKPHTFWMKIKLSFIPFQVTLFWHFFNICEMWPYIFYIYGRAYFRISNFIITIFCLFVSFFFLALRWKSFARHTASFTYNIQINRDIHTPENENREKM